MWSITRELLRRGLLLLKNITRYNTKHYKPTEKGESLLSSITEAKQEVPPKQETYGDSIWPYGLIEFKIHAIRYKQPLLRKPSWLYQITRIAQHDGLVIKRVKMNNWDKYLIILHDYKTYHAIYNIEICNNYVIYNFEMTSKDSLVSDIEGFDKFKEERIEGCVQGRKKLEQIGFQIGSDEEIVPAQNFHYVFKTEKELRHNDLGNFIVAYIKDGKRTIMHDHSPKVGPAHIEIDNETDVKNILEAPKKVKKIEADIYYLKNAMKQLIQIQTKAVESQINNQTQLNDIQSDIKALVTHLKGVSNQDSNQRHNEGMFL